MEDGCKKRRGGEVEEEGEKGTQEEEGKVGEKE